MWTNTEFSLVEWLLSYNSYEKSIDYATSIFMYFRPLIYKKNLLKYVSTILLLFFYQISEFFKA